MYIRIQNKETQKWENVCFEDLEEEQQDAYLETQSLTFIKEVAKLMANTLHEIREQFDLIKE